MRGRGHVGVGRSSSTLKALKAQVLCVAAGVREGPLKRELQLHRRKLADVAPPPPRAESIDLDSPRTVASLEEASAAKGKPTEEPSADVGVPVGSVDAKGTRVYADRDGSAEAVDAEAAEQLETPMTPVERLRAELWGTLEGVVENAFDPIRGSHLRRKQLEQLIGKAETPQVRAHFRALFARNPRKSRPGGLFLDNPCGASTTCLQHLLLNTC